MRTLARRAAVPFAALALLVGLTSPTSAYADTPPVDEVSSDNVELVANVPKPEAVSNTNSDLAFTGDYAIGGNYDGFVIYDISEPEDPRIVSEVVCPGGQGDVSVSGDLLYFAVDYPRAGEDCGAPAVPTTDPNGFEGVRIFDISDKSAPEYVAAVATDCGSHTLTLVPGDDEREYVYVSSYSPSASFPNCQPPHDKISIIEVPLEDPASAEVVDAPVLFPDGGHRTTTGCHDITVYPAKDLAAGACMGDGILMDISDPAAPVVTEVVQDTNFAFWHSATFTNDASTVIFTDELGGGGAPTCTEEIGPERGANAIYKLERDGSLTFQSYFKIDRHQGDQVCVAHNRAVLVPGRGVGHRLQRPEEPPRDRLLRRRLPCRRRGPGQRHLVGVLLQRLRLLLRHRPGPRRPEADGPASASGRARHLRRVQPADPTGLPARSLTGPTAPRNLPSRGDERRRPGRPGTVRAVALTSDHERWAGRGWSGEEVFGCVGLDGLGDPLFEGGQVGAGFDASAGVGGEGESSGFEDGDDASGGLVGPPFLASFFPPFLESLFASFFAADADVFAGEVALPLVGAHAHQALQFLPGGLVETCQNVVIIERPILFGRGIQRLHHRLQRLRIVVAVSTGGQYGQFREGSCPLDPRDLGGPARADGQGRQVEARVAGPDRSGAPRRDGVGRTQDQKHRRAPQPDVEGDQVGGPAAPFPLVMAVLAFDHHGHDVLGALAEHHGSVAVELLGVAVGQDRTGVERLGVVWNLDAEGFQQGRGHVGSVLHQPEGDLVLSCGHTASWGPMTVENAL
ncbi:LVIVD repeat family protein [Nocardiopsis alba ATCC BAA-2165]|uniref:LVIVD repeat family protein n=1 Tax=Nocardiopsis alba (strain ATCC BAA-2165 / BE74) TaxID=1205910 RepID=J7L6H5_NOCAA|nr:LVIVD repeat family protein [Nocardiopsis alba ATCC BAA-2165]